MDELRFDTLSGELVVRRGEVDTAAAASLLCMDFPLVPASAEEVPPGLGPGSDLVKARRSLFWPCYSLLLLLMWGQAVEAAGREERSDWRKLGVQRTLRPSAPQNTPPSSFKTKNTTCTGLQPTLQAVVGDLPVEDVRYAPSLRYLLVALREGSGSAPGAARAALEGLQPDPQRLLAAYGGGKLGVIVTARGAATFCGGCDRALLARVV